MSTDPSINIPALARMARLFDVSAQHAGPRGRT